MSPRTVRTVRTVLQILLAVCAAVPAFVNGLPGLAIGAQLVVVAGAITHYFYVLEALPFFPDALKLSK